MAEDLDKPIVLLADDDTEIRQMVRRALSGLDLHFIEARDGEEALTRVIEEGPDLVVLDVMMPALNGWEICKYIRSKPELEHIKVLMLTGIGHTVNEMTSPLYGADAALDKPFDLNELTAEVKRLLTESAREAIAAEAAEAE
jgi:DNA-binding response OmpR family regulator